MYASIAGIMLMTLEQQGKLPYAYVEDTSRIVGVHRGNSVFLGKLDHAGNFLREAKWPPLRLGAGESGVPDYELINLRRPGRIHVYEYRSGRLIKGEIDEDGNFVPDLGERVIQFKEYEYSEAKDAVRIYNLPGRFVPTK